MTTVVRAADIRRVAVLGAGTMGRGIAQVAALAGCEVRLRDVEARFAEGGLGKIRETLDGGVARGKLAATDSDAAAARLTATTSLPDAVRDADAVIEAFPEDLALKRATFAEVEAHAPDSALLATNTSSLRIGTIAESLRTPARFAGMHFFNPAHILKLVEIVVGPTTAPETVASARGLGLRMGQGPSVVLASPGCAWGRVGVGIGPAFAPPRVLRDHVAKGKLGKKTGEGFYVWEGDTAREPT